MLKLSLLFRSVLERSDGDVFYVPKCVEAATEVDYGDVPLSAEVYSPFQECAGEN